jgi:hypothetical protein
MFIGEEAALGLHPIGVPCSGLVSPAEHGAPTERVWFEVPQL